jgi:hypothetical protein
VARGGAAPRSGQQAALGADVIDLLHALATPGVLISHPNTGFLMYVVYFEMAFSSVRAWPI